MGTWDVVNQQTAKGRQILDCMWVYGYKFNKHGRLQKCKARCKARLIVRGDQQWKLTVGSTYASTLARRSFRGLMVIPARLDLELIQYDAVNAFVNAHLPREVYMRILLGYRERSKICRVLRALYGLKESLLLWQKELTKTLRELGFQPVAQEPYCYLKDEVIIFFYMDDIILSFRKDKQGLAEQLINVLKARYELTGGENLQWFLGIEVIRDRKAKKIYLSQSDYIDKLRNLLPKGTRQRKFETLWRTLSYY